MFAPGSYCTLVNESSNYITFLLAVITPIPYLNCGNLYIHSSQEVLAVKDKEK
jgi:hypothetical protein